MNMTVWLWLENRHPVPKTMLAPLHQKQFHTYMYIAISVKQISVQNWTYYVKVRQRKHT